MSQFTVRNETQTDYPGTDAVVAAAFERRDEADIVAAIRAAEEVELSLVAELAGVVIGHVLASPIRIEGAPGRYLGIAPVSVTPAHQGAGVGSALMREAIAATRRDGVDALFLLGNPAYYKRFGFTRATVGNQFGATDAFQQLELVPGCLDGVSGTARYVDAFAP